jgi:hypothetical protein
MLEVGIGVPGETAEQFQPRISRNPCDTDPDARIVMHRTLSYTIVAAAGQGKLLILLAA